MSVLVKGMEMPHDCDECRLCAFIPVGDYGIHRKCLPLNAKAEITIRRADCPLIPVPPHGRLIDADAAVANRDANMNWCYDLYDLPDYLSGCPTIIEAEEGE